MAFSKILVRTTVIAGLVGLVGLAIVGPVRAKILADKVRGNINSAVDACIDDPSALRAQIRELEAQYAPRIAQTRSDLGQVKAQIAELKREQVVAQRVVEIAQADLQKLHGMLARAETVRDLNSSVVVANYSSGGGLQTEENPAEVRINFNNESLSFDQAVSKAQQVEQVISAYVSRHDEIERDLGYMAEQQKRLGELNDKLETERSQFQAQLVALDHQIDAIARNDRLIEMMKRREESLAANSRYEAGSLENLKGRLAEIRTKQEAELETIGRGSTSNSYEAKAKIDLDARNRALKPYQPWTKPTKKVIEIGPGDALPMLPESTTPAEPKAEPAKADPAKTGTIARK